MSSLIKPEMTAEDMWKIFKENFPETFDYWYRFCNALYKSSSCEELSEITKNFLQHSEMKLAYATVYDFSETEANKIGKIIVAATDRRMNE